LLDAASFSAHFAGSHASKSTPHLYISALSTWNQDSPVWTYWKHQFTSLPSITLLNGAITVPLLTITTNRRLTGSAVSGKGDQIVSSAHDDFSLLVWDTKTGYLLKKLKGHTDHVRSVAFSSNGDQIVSCSKDNSVRVWDAKTGHQIMELARSYQ
jgi:WD40 repeat protein